MWDYGFAPADVVTDSAGDVRPGIELRVWDAEVAGKAIAVQQDRGDGWKPVSRVLTDDVGRYRFKSETGPTVWLEDASGRRWRMDAWQTLGTMIDSAQTAVTVSQAASSTADEALDTATGAASQAAASASSASAAQTAAAASAMDAAASATIAQGAQIAANIGNSWWRTGSGAPPTYVDAVDAPIVGARYRDTASKKTWVATFVATMAGEATVEWEQTGPLPADMSATVEAQRLAKIVPGKTNPAAGLPQAIPPAGARFIIQAGSAVATTNAAEDFAFNWPEAFPTAILSVQLTSGDSMVYGGPIVVHNATTLTTCRAHAAGRVNGPLRCDYIAIGY